MIMKIIQQNANRKTLHYTIQELKKSERREKHVIFKSKLNEKKIQLFQIYGIGTGLSISLCMVGLILKTKVMYEFRSPIFFPDLIIKMNLHH